MITFAYDKVLSKVGCAIIQAQYNTNISSYHLQCFGTENWLTHPTKDMEVYKCSNELELNSVIIYTKLSNIAIESIESTKISY